MMRIGFSGVSSTGKSTLARAIAAHYDVPLLDEGMKHVYQRHEAEWGPAPKFETMPDWQKLKFQKEMIEHRTKAELEATSFVGDGTPLDIMAFWLEWSTRFKVEEQEYIEYQDLLEVGLTRYELIIRCPFGAIPIEDDTRRFTDQRFLKKMAWILDGVTWDHDTNGLSSPNVITLQSTSLENRISEIHEILSAELKPSALFR